MKLKDEVKRRNSFEKGTPCIYHDGENEITGEVITNSRGFQAIAPYYTDGRSGTKDFDVVPRTWFNVRKFNSSEKKYTKTHKDRNAMEKHIEKLIGRNASYSINGNQLNYWF